MGSLLAYVGFINNRLQEYCTYLHYFCIRFHTATITITLYVMKRPGSTSDFIEHRNRELHKSFLSVLRTESMPLRLMFGAAASRPAPRFWVSERRAADVIGRMMRGLPDEGMLPKRREMFEEILRRVRAKMEADPSMCMTAAVAETVNEPAPEFYMTPESARSVIYRMRRRARLAGRIRAKLAGTPETKRQP